MSTSGMVRKVDGLGRIVLPVEMRRMFAIRAGDALEIGVDEAGIVLRKVESRCVFCGGTESLRPFRGKQLCASCAGELSVAGRRAEGNDHGRSGEEGLPPPGEPQGEFIDAPPRNT